MDSAVLGKLWSKFATSEKLLVVMQTSKCLHIMHYGKSVSRSLHSIVHEKMKS